MKKSDCHCPCCVRARRADLVTRLILITAFLCSLFAMGMLSSCTRRTDPAFLPTAAAALFQLQTSEDTPGSFSASPPRADGFATFYGKP